MPQLRAIDCDVHPAVPDMATLMPYLPDHWRDAVAERGIPSLESISYPPHAPITARADWRGAGGLAAASLGDIERCAPDRRFVQILLLAMGEVPLGRRQFWPLYAAAERHGLPIGIHAGSAYRHPVTSLGWPSYYAEDYAAQTQGFQSQVASLISEGVFAKFPGLKVVLIESGVTWLPGFLWRFAKFWRGLRSEVPWVDRSPAEIVRDHFRLTIQPLDAPPAPEAVERAIDHLRSDDMLLYASDFPHWQFDGDDVMPPGIPAAMQRKILVDNPMATYNRLKTANGE